MAKKKKENKTKNTTEFDIKKTQMPIVTKEKNQTTIIKNDISQIENQQINNLIQKFTFTNSMFLTTVIEDKKIYLWDEKVCSTVFTYEDDSNKGSYSLIECVNKNLFSENIYAILPNKSLITVYDTSNQNPLYKTVPLQESINSISTNNNLLAIGTIKGNVHLFELSTGNTITIFKVSFSQIIGLHIDNKDFITTLTNESIKIYNYETLFFEKNDEFAKETSTFINKDCYFDFYKILLDESLISLVSETKISIYDFPFLKNNIKSIYFDEEITLAKLDSNTKKDIYIAIENRIYIYDFFKKYEDPYIINQKNLLKVIDTETPILCLEIGSTSIAVAFQSGEIHLFSLFDFKFTNKYCQIKGTITNILKINRPISQFGLNYNSEICSKDVRKLERINNNTINQISNYSFDKEEDYINNLINKNS